MEEIKKEEEDDGKRKRKASFDDYFLYSSDEYKEKVIKKFSRQNLLNIILTRPTMKLKHIQTDTYIESTAINFCPLGNLVFCRDQQITTKKGVVIGKSRTTNDPAQDPKDPKPSGKTYTQDDIGKMMAAKAKEVESNLQDDF